MKTQGRVVRWDNARGFGFIRATEGGQDIFFHARDFRSASGPPRIGLDVAFEQVQVGGKGPRAMAVQPVGMRSASESPPQRRPSATQRGPVRTPPSGAWFALALMALYAAALAWGVVSRVFPWWILAASFALNLLAFLAYWQDKHAAEKGQWRTPEATLHLWSLAGGWGGAWIAQRLLRHKSSKSAFLRVYWTTVATHCAALGYWWVQAGR